VFFLYFQSVLPVDRVLLLEAIYYAGVVVLEVPSGYFSDRIGRKPTLLVASACWCAACALFALSSSFGAFVAAQLLLAAGMAFNSGTDTSFLYDSLASIGRGHEIVAQEGRAESFAFIALAVAAVAGGFLAGLDLRIAYALSALSAAVAFAVALRFTEPPARAGAHAPLRQLRLAGGRLRDPALRWVFLLGVSMTVFEHVPYELLQPALELMLAALDRPGYALAPPASGLLAGVAMAASAVASRQAAALKAWIGVVPTLLLAYALMGVVIGAMGITLHPAVLLVVALRSVPHALIGPVMNGVIHPRVESAVRATYFSLQSLAGRLAFAACLGAASFALGGLDRLTPPEFSVLALSSAAAVALLLLLLAATRPAI
jgi:MFS family permease